MPRSSEDRNKAIEFSIGPMRVGDLDEVAQLEGLCHLDRWGASAAQLIKDQSQAIMLVARPADARQSNHPLLGFLCSLVVADEWQIYNVATHPDVRRRGIAGSLMGEGRARARAMGATQGFLEVRESNQAARALYEKLGFVVAGQRKAFYRDPAEDGLVMRCDLMT
jgi:ribosomal-protein-alanine N-acetyltransferase